MMVIASLCTDVTKLVFRRPYQITGLGSFVRSHKSSLGGSTNISMESLSSVAQGQNPEFSMLSGLQNDKTQGSKA
jgi:hypothetical protein